MFVLAHEREKQPPDARVRRTIIAFFDHYAAIYDQLVPNKPASFIHVSRKKVQGPINCACWMERLVVDLAQKVMYPNPVAGYTNNPWEATTYNGPMPPGTKIESCVRRSL